MQLPLSTYFLIFGIVAGSTVYFRHPVPLYLRLFPVYLLMSIMVEVVALWMVPKFGGNLALYNFYNLFSFCFLLFVLREIITSRTFKKVIVFSIGFFLAFALYNLFFWQKLEAWNSMSYAIGSLLIVTFCFYYFFELFKKAVSTKLTREPPFWIVCGLLFFYCCSFPILGLNNFLRYVPEVLLRSMGSIIMVLNILLYLLFAIAFLCRFYTNKPGQKA
jgi:hypothetical protein